MTSPSSAASADLRAFTRNVLALLTGNVLAQAVTYLTIPLITRLYPPSAFGVFAVFYSLTALLSSVANLRYNSAILIPPDQETANSLTLLSILLAGGFSLVACAAMGAAEILDASPFGQGAGGFALLAALSIFLGGISNPLAFHWLRAREFTRLAVSRVGMSTGSRGFSLLWGLASAAPAGLIFGHVGGQALSLAPLLWDRGRRSLRALFSRATLANVFPVARRFRAFPLYSWTNLVEIGSRELPILLLGAFFSSSVTGIYALCVRVLGQPTNLLGDAIARVYFQKAAELDDRQAARGELTLTLLRFMTLFLAFPLCLLAMLAPNLLALALGGQWADAAPCLRALTPMFFTAFLSRPLTVIFDIQARQKERSWMGLAMLAASTGALVLGGVLDRPLLGILLASASVTLITVWFIAKLLGMLGLSPLPVLRVLGLDLGKALLFASVALLPQIQGTAATLLAGVAVTAAYGGYLFKTERELLRLARNSLRQAPRNSRGEAG